MSNDLISRQAAIEAIVNTPTDVYSHDSIVSVLDGVAFRQNEIIDIIEELLSAQPEIIRCKDCRYANECHKSVQYTRNEPNSITIGYSPIEWCSNGKRLEK